MVTIVSEGITVETAEPVCTTCFAGPVAAESRTTLCGDCLDAACAWEVFKDRNGYKPRGWTDAELVAWLRTQPVEVAS